MGREPPACHPINLQPQTTIMAGKVIFQNSITAELKIKVNGLSGTPDYAPTDPSIVVLSQVQANTDSLPSTAPLDAAIKNRQGDNIVGESDTNKLEIWRDLDDDEQLVVADAQTVHFEIDSAAFNRKNDDLVIKIFDVGSERCALLILDQEGSTMGNESGGPA